MSPRAIVAEDESVLRIELGELLAQVWPELDVLALVGDGLEAVARAPHGVIEAVEMPLARAYVLGVQWELHEEWQDDERSLGIWRAFVKAAIERADAREKATVG